MAVHVGLEVWEGITTGTIAGKYGRIPQASRPWTYGIGVALTTLATVIWASLSALASLILFKWRG